MSQGFSEIEDFIVRKDLSEVDPDTELIINFEEERQARRLILIPSESLAPLAVRQALGSVFNNIYAEGYPPLQMTREEVNQILDYKWQLERYRRYGDRRFYKGTEYVDFIECLAQRRCAQCFATPEIPPDQIFVNVQPLSGAAANNVVYEAFVEPGAPVMGMALAEGGHLTHGSEFNRSGKRYRIVSYGGSHVTGRLDYDEIMNLALEHRPKMIIAGYTSYTWAPDWAKFREICDAVGDCILLADIAHPAGLVVAGEYPSPLGYADVITFTTHKTLCGPRGAVIMTTDEAMASVIDQTVFPGEQGGPHVNKFAAMAVAFKIAQTEKFRKLQRQIVANARYLAQALEERGISLAYGGTDTHFCVADLRTVKSTAGFPLKGEIAARILDLCGIVVNKNTIPGDDTAAEASGVRLGAPWITQRGFKEPHIQRLADILAEVLHSIQPFSYVGATGILPRGKIALDVLERLKIQTHELIEATVSIESPTRRGYLHRHLTEAKSLSVEGRRDLAPEVCTAMDLHRLFNCGDIGLLAIRGERAGAFLQNVVTGDISALGNGESLHTFLLDETGMLIDDIVVVNVSQHEEMRCQIVTHACAHDRVAAWLRGHSQGYIIFDKEDIHRKIEGPVVIDDLADESADPEDHVSTGALKLTADKAQIENRQQAELPIFDGGEQVPTGLELLRNGHTDKFALTKGYFIGQRAIEQAVDVPAKTKIFAWQEQESDELRHTPLFEEHYKLTRRFIPFAGWEMPVWYTSISEEHAAVRNAAGLFDIGHMGVLEISGRHAVSFLDAVTSNYVRRLEIGQSQYSYILDLGGIPMDDVIVYRRGLQKFMMVVNATNAEKIWAWLNVVNSREYVLDRQFPHRAIEGTVQLRNLKDPSAGERQLVGGALQGPVSAVLLQELRSENRLAGPLAALAKFELMEDEVAGVPTLISRTGYTGEQIGFELYVHPDSAVRLWNLLLEAGEQYGARPTGLGARDSTRIEAGLPLYGHEIAGSHRITPTAAGYGAYVKLHKPFFVGREAFMAREQDRKMEIVRFQLDQPGARAIRHGAVVASKRGEYAGTVTSCALVGLQQVGLAYVDRRLAREGTPIVIFPLRQAEKGAVPVSPTDLSLGERMLLHESATILTRFPCQDHSQPDSLGRATLSGP